MNNLKKLFLLILLSGFSANLSVFSMNSSSEEEGEKQGNKRKHEPTEQVSEQEEKRNKVDQEENCPICFVPLQKKEQQQLISLHPEETIQHIFHEECLKSWMKTSRTCPLCRIEIPNEIFPNIQPNAPEEQIGEEIVIEDEAVRNLFEASFNGDNQMLQTLLETPNFDVNISILNRTTPLYIAAQQGHIQVVHELLNHGANVNITNSFEETPLITASRYGHIQVVKELLTRDASVNITNSHGETSLSLAVQNGNIETAQELLKSGANANIGDHGLTPLWWAAYLGNPEIVQSLLYYNASVNDIEINTNTTALSIAAINGHLQIVQLLLDYRNNINHQNVIIRQQDLEIENLNPEIREILQKKFEEQQSHN